MKKIPGERAIVVKWSAVLAAALILISIPALTKPQQASTNEATEVKLPELGQLKDNKGTNCPTCVKDTPGKSFRVVENPNSPIYFHRDKNSSYHQPGIPAGDNGHLLQVDLTAPGKIFNVVQDCHGRACGWTHGCESGWCAGHNVPVEYHNNNTATWWGWSNSGDNAELIFIVHYE